MTAPTVTAVTYQTSPVGNYDVGSCTGSCTSFTHVASCNEHGNLGLGGRGNWAYSCRSCGTPGVGCPHQARCSKLDATVCPTIGEGTATPAAPTTIAWANGGNPQPNRQNSSGQIACQTTSAGRAACTYDAEDLQASEANMQEFYNTFVANPDLTNSAYNDLPQQADIATNTAAWASVLPAFCSQPTNVGCPTVPNILGLTGTNPPVCSRMISTDPFNQATCGALYNTVINAVANGQTPDPTQEAVVTNAINSYCGNITDLSQAPDCACAQRALSPYYISTGAPEPDSCFWRPCQQPNNFVVPPNLVLSTQSQVCGDICQEVVNLYTSAGLSGNTNVQQGISCSFGNTGSTGCTGCASGQVCNNGVCVGPTGCSVNSDCPSGYVCSGGACVPTGTTGPTGCSGNSDCPSGYACSSGVCIPTGPTGTCTDASQCAPGQRCQNGQCVSGGGGSTGHVWIWVVVAVVVVLILALLFLFMFAASRRRG